jgi:hypothetical protein
VIGIIAKGIMPENTWKDSLPRNISEKQAL